MADKMNSENLLNQADIVWRMLDDLADSSPGGYKRFMDKTLKDGSGFFKPPEPCFCVSTILLPSVVTHRLFVNICSWEQMPAPKTEQDPIPVMAGELQQTTEEESTYTVVDIVVNQVVTKGVENSKDRRNLLVHVALDYLENTKSIQVSRKYKILKSKFKGDPKRLAQYLRQKDQQGVAPTGPGQDKAGVSDTPESLLKQLSSIAVSDTKSEENPAISLFERSGKPKKGLIEEVSSTSIQPQPVTPNYEIQVRDAENTKPRRVLVKVDLPDVTSSSHCQLDVCQMELSLGVPGRYKLRVKLPEKVDKEQTTATFNTVAHRLIVKLPTQS